MVNHTPLIRKVIAIAHVFVYAQLSYHMVRSFGIVIHNILRRRPKYLRLFLIECRDDSVKNRASTQSLNFDAF